MRSATSTMVSRSPRSRRPSETGADLRAALRACGSGAASVPRPSSRTMRLRTTLLGRRGSQSRVEGVKVKGVRPCASSGLIPVSSTYRMRPREKTSLAVVIGPPRICSGLA